MFLLLAECLTSEITVVSVALLMLMCVWVNYFILLFNWTNGALGLCFLCTDNRLY
jgi:hypothetical protein